MPTLGMIILSGILVATAAAFLTQVVRKYAIKDAVLDNPNERSLHAAPVPRGGGLAFAAISVLCWCLAAVYTDLPLKILLGLLLPLFILSVVGWLDDKNNLNISIRLVAQVVASMLAIIILGNLQQISVAGLTFDLGILAWPLSLVWIVWMVNLYNFMDGIDGIASVQGIIAASTIGVWYGIRSELGMTLICFSVAAAVAGFLYYNWPPAKIFMGDSGSLFLGGFFAINAIIASAQFGLPFDAFLILFGVFLADATLTLIRRMLRKEPWWRAHRSHYYQRAVQSGLSHANVSLSVLALSVVLALFASMRVLEIGAAWLWLTAAILVLCLTAALVIHRESVHTVSADG